MSTDEIFQESPRLKAQWLAAAKRTFPVGAGVRIIASDFDAYVGATGTVVDYDLGMSGDWPLIVVRFDTPREGRLRDGFYDEELERLPRGLGGVARLSMRGGRK